MQDFRFFIQFGKLYRIIKINQIQAFKAEFLKFEVIKTKQLKSVKVENFKMVKYQIRSFQHLKL